MSRDADNAATERGGAAASVPEEAPPFGSWRGIYAAIVLYTALVVVLLYAMTVALER